MNHDHTNTHRPRAARIWQWMVAAVVAVTTVAGPARAQCGCLPDFDGNGVVGFADLQVILQNWGTLGPSNIDGSGLTGFADLNILLQSWGACPEEPDADDDGTPDCADGCPNDENKIAPGNCGCGVSDTADGDGDGVVDCLDQCPGQNDTLDTDGDGVPDCQDDCPNDANKTEPGACGCGVVDGLGCTGDIVSDDFNGCGVNNALWMVIDPAGLATIEQTNSGTEAARLEITVPPGVSYDAWVPENSSARLMQPAANVDFQLEAKFGSVPTAEFQEQGILIEQDADNFLRLELNSNVGKGLRVFTAAIVDDTPTTFDLENIPELSPPVFLRVTRSCDDWTVEYGTNGVDWTVGSIFNHPLTVTAVGVHAGSTGDTPPGYMALVDYFLNNAVEPAVPDGPLPGAEAYTLDVSVAGGNGTVSVTPDQPTYACDTVTIEALPSGGFTFAGWTGDVVSNDNPLTIDVGGDLTIVANVLDIAQTASIEGRQVFPGTTSALITWETDLPASSVVDYGETSSLDLGSVSDSELTTHHAILLTGLTPDTTHFYRASGTTQGGAQSSTVDLSFDTLPLGVDDLGAVSDDFNAFNLDSDLWSLFDPDGTAVLFTSGVGTDAAAINIQLPPGPDEISLMQPANNTDFDLTAKFDNVPVNLLEGFGVQAQTDSDSWVRFEYFNNGFNNRFFGGINENGVFTDILGTSINLPAPLYMRLTRSGNVWDFWYSGDGQTWTFLTSTTYDTVVDEVGVIAAHIGFTPTYTTTIDFFEVTNDPFVAEDGQAGVPNDTPPYIYHINATARQNGPNIELDVTWDTDEASRSLVDYGLTTNYELGAVNDPAFVTEHLMNAVVPVVAERLEVRIRSSDAGSNIGTAVLTVPVRACGGP